MPKVIFQTFVVGLTVTLLAGCASTKKQTESMGQDKKTKGGISVRTYVEDRPRLDQDMTGNFGYIVGQGQPEDRSDFKKTQRIYVLEVTKEITEPVEVAQYEMKPVPNVEPVRVPAQEPVKEPEWRKPVVIPVIESEKVTPAGETRYEEYVVQEGDTLQKISKKYYGSFSKWMRIYEVNKEVLRNNPDRIKAGMKLQIPIQ